MGGPRDLLDRLPQRRNPRRGPFRPFSVSLVSSRKPRSRQTAKKKRRSSRSAVWTRVQSSDEKWTSSRTDRRFLASCICEASTDPFDFWPGRAGLHGIVLQRRRQRCGCGTARRERTWKAQRVSCRFMWVSRAREESDRGTHLGRERCRLDVSLVVRRPLLLLARSEHRLQRPVREMETCESALRAVLTAKGSGRTGRRLGS